MINDFKPCHHRVWSARKPGNKCGYISKNISEDFSFWDSPKVPLPSPYSGIFTNICESGDCNAIKFSSQKCIIGCKIQALLDLGKSGIGLSPRVRWIPPKMLVRIASFPATVPCKHFHVKLCLSIFVCQHLFLNVSVSTFLCQHLFVKIFIHIWMMPQAC